MVLAQMISGLSYLLQNISISLLEKMTTLMRQARDGDTFIIQQYEESQGCY